MIELHPEFLSKNGKPEFAALPYEEYLEVRRVMEDAQVLMELREAKAAEGDAPGLTLEEAKRALGIS